MIENRWSIKTYYDRLKNGIDFESLNIDDWALMQGGLRNAPCRENRFKDSEGCQEA